VVEDAATNPGTKNPVVQIVRKRFAKNTPYTSFRLIYASMAAGYKVGRGELFFCYFDLRDTGFHECMDLSLLTCMLIKICSS
jgi:hypothetical protein